jgi:hypothetical protein
MPCFWLRRSLDNFLPKLASNCNPPSLSLSRVSGITGMSHGSQSLVANTFLTPRFHIRIQ